MVKSALVWLCVCVCVIGLQVNKGLVFYENETFIHRPLLFVSHRTRVRRFLPNLSPWPVAVEQFLTYVTSSRHHHHRHQTQRIDLLLIIPTTTARYRPIDTSVSLISDVIISNLRALNKKGYYK